MNKTGILLIMLNVILLANTACKDDCQSNLLPDKKFTPAEVAIVPYVGGKRYIFKNSINDSICFYSHNPIYKMEYVSDTLPKSYWEDLEGCLGDTRYSEDITWYLKTSIEFDTVIMLRIRFYHPFGEDENLKDLNIYLTYEATAQFGGWFSFYNYLDDKDTIVSLGHSLHYLNQHGDDEVNAYHLSIEINGHTFENVYEMLYLSDYTDAAVYYSISLGIVGFRDQDGVLWHLDKIL